MLGELIEEESGKITGKRVVDVEGPKIESSFTMNGRWVGQDVTDIGDVLGSYERGNRNTRSSVWRSTRSGNNQRCTGNGNLHSPRDRKIYRSRKNKIPWISVLSYKSNKRRKTIIP